MQNTNEKMIGKKSKKNISLGRFWQGFWGGLGRFGGYKNKIKKKLRKRRDGRPGIDIYSWG